MTEKQINICTVRGWILRKLATMITNKHGTEHHIEMSQPFCAKEGFINIYMDIFNTYKDYKREGGTHIGFFTHLINWQDENWLANLDREIAWSKLDGIITMTDHHANLLREYGYKGSIQKIIPGNFTRSFQISPLKLLIAQRGDEAHYGQKFVLELLDALEPAVFLNLDFIIVGDGWEPTIAKMRQLGIIVEHWKDSDTSTTYPNSYQQLYNWCDYVFIPMYEAGGPMCLMEAMACGKPVIASMVGWVKEYAHTQIRNPSLFFDPGDVYSAKMHLTNILAERRLLRNEVKFDGDKELSWSNFANSVIQFAVRVDEEN